jgi:cell division septum initiation protein DivIVA
MIKKFSFLLSVLLLTEFTAVAQIQLTPFIDSTKGGLDENNIAVMEGNLRTLMTRAGVESGYGGRFVLAVKVTLLDKTMTSTAPVKVLQNMQINVAIGDAEANICFGTTTIETRGLGDTDVHATLNAFRNMRVTPELKQLIAESKTRIIDYYDKNCNAIIAKAKSLVTGQKYEEALSVLAAVPRECVSYPQVAALMTDVYQTNINHDASQILNEAQAVWSADPNPGPAADEAMRILSQIDPQAKCYPQAQALMKKIEARVKTVTDTNAAHERNMDKARLNAETALEKARLNAARDVAVAYAKSRPRVVYNVYHWW